MTKKTILINKAAKLSTQNKQLIIKQEEKYTVPLSDINNIIIDTPQLIITSALLSKISENGISIIVCNKQHLPNGLFHPIYKHSRQSEIAHIQANIADSFYKRCWSKIIKSKINNQARFLKIHNFKDSANKLQCLKEDIKLGDKNNREAYAAKIYWQTIENDLVKNIKNKFKSLCYYGYSIIRSCIVRELVNSGFIPNFGIFHNNKLNPFNLADDLIEPYRSFIDLIVYYEIDNNSNQFTQKEKINLINSLNNRIKFKNQNVIISNSITLLIDSLKIAFIKQDSKYLELPELLNFKNKQEYLENYHDTIE